MKRFLAAFLLVALALCAWAQPDPAFSQIDEILSDLARITGLKPLRAVQYATMDRPQLKQYLEQRMQEVVKPEELRADEMTLKKFGFVPQDFDLKSSTVDLLTEQAAAFYDFRKKKLYLLESYSGMLQQSALVHELAHALADQHFHLEKFIRRGQRSDDGSLAHMAVMEGQASWLMSEYVMQKSGRSLKDHPEMIEMMGQATSMSAGSQFPVLERVPMYLRETLLFPYTRGMLFQHRVFEKLGQEAFSEVFRSPPASTQQILHPEKYFAHVAPAKPELPRASPGRGYHTLSEGEVGELDHAVLLRQYAGDKESTRLSPLWKGGAYRLLENRKAQRTVLLYASEWESPETAREYFNAYRAVLKGKWKSMEVGEENGRLLAGKGDDGRFAVRLEGNRVTSVEGMAELR